MQAFVVVFLLGVVLALVWGGRRQPGQIVVVPAYVAHRPERTPRRRIGWIWPFVFALAIGAVLAFWLQWEAADYDPYISAFSPAIDQPDRPAALVGATMPVAATPQTVADTASATELNDQGKALMQQGLYAEAELRFSQAIARDPTAYEPYNNLAFCLYERGAISAAIDAWRQALDHNQDSADAWAGLGMALFVSGQADAGRAHYQQARERNLGYADEAWMRAERLWSARALADSRPLR